MTHEDNVIQYAINEIQSKLNVIINYSFFLNVIYRFKITIPFNGKFIIEIEVEKIQDPTIFTTLLFKEISNKWTELLKK